MVRRLVVAASIGALLALPAWAEQTREIREIEGLERLIVELADGPSEHAALARHFQAKARAARADAAQHERLASSPLHHRKPTELRFMRERYERIAENLLAEAARYEARAEHHLAEARRSETVPPDAKTAEATPPTTAPVEAD